MVDTLIRRSGALLATTALAALAFSAPAAAHVRSDGTDLAQGGYGIVRLIAPGESATANTVGITVTIPAGVDLKSARTLPIPGWTATIEREPKGEGQRVARIVWTAADPANGYGNAEYREFAFSAGPWPEDQESIALPTDQAYSDGSVVSWNEVAVDETSEPEHPAPVVGLVADPDGHGHDGHDRSAAASDEPHTQAASASSDWLWRSISVVSLALALAAGAGAALVLRRDRGAGS